MTYSHRFAPFAIVILAALALLLGSTISAAPPSRALLPVVYGQPVASVCDGLAPILDRDTGSLSVMYQGGDWYVSYQDRAQRGRGHLAKHVGDRLVEVLEPVETAPMFSPPDSVKVGSVALATNGQIRRWYYTQRKPGDVTGPYGVWCVDF